MVPREDCGIRVCLCPDCYLCGSDGKLLYKGLVDRLFEAPGKWDLVKCANPQCGLVWLNPMPLEDEIGKVYLDYFTHHSCSENPKNIEKLVWLNAWRIYRALLCLTWIRPERRHRSRMYLDTISPGRLLDVGCGNGQFLALMHSEGWQVEGQELDPVAAERALKTHGMRIRVGKLEDIGYPDDSFDAVVMSHVIEHVRDPIAILKECLRILKPRGMFVAITPNVNGLGHRYFKSCYRDLDPPRHLYLFTQKTLKHVGKKAGFTNCRVQTSALDIVYDVGIGSLDIRRNGYHLMEANPNINRSIKAMLFHLLARIFLIWDKGSGEECILRATK